LRNRESARYARWSAIAAALIAAAVLLVYAERAYREVRARREAPKPVPITVQQQSSQFSFSKEEGNHKLFTVRASSATQYKDQNRALLEDVWITIYGRDGNRNDNIHTRECSYEPETGEVRCEGQVEIDVGAGDESGSNPKDAAPAHLAVKASNLSFNRNTGEASTPAGVEFQFPAGQGRGTGAAYSTREGVLRVRHDVVFQIAPSARTGGLPVDINGSALEIRRNDRSVVLKGPCHVKEGSRELEAKSISVEFDKDYHARRFLADDHPQIRSDDSHGRIEIAADQIVGSLNPAGWIESLMAEGNVSGTRQISAGVDHFSARRVEFSMLPASNLLKEMTASGNVLAEVHQSADTHILKTDALRVTFSPGQPANSAVGGPRQGSIEHQRVESAETLAPAIIESRTAKDTTTLRAKKFVAKVSADGRLEKLLGHSGVEIQRQSGSGTPQTVSASEMAVTFDQHGQWSAVEETGAVSFRQADRRASASRGSIVRATDTITLDGSPEISDSMSQTTAGSITLNQNSGEIKAGGGVVSTYISAKQGGAVGLGSGAAHISADSLSAAANAGHAAYVGHARLWQGDAVLESDQIELWRDDKKLQATGRVVAALPQTTGPLTALPGNRAATHSTGPTLWKISAPRLTYWSDRGEAHLDGGVRASSDQGSLESRTLDAFLETGQAPPGASETPAPVSGGRQLTRVLAQGNVIVRQGERRGTAEQAEYTAADGKFVLSGGQPTLANAASDTTTGHSLTFFVADDTILIDSQEGSRTVTKHRVEK
jgi:lipopolysaccharide export system protein LptA